MTARETTADTITWDEWRQHAIRSARRADIYARAAAFVAGAGAIGWLAYALMKSPGTF